MKEDLVNKPKHYNQGNIEVIDFITDQQMDYIEGNIIKYIARYKYKNGKQDLLKAQFYLSKLIEGITHPPKSTLIIGDTDNEKSDPEILKKRKSLG